MPLVEGTTVGVLGAGAMGAGIAQVAATNGHPVVLVDESRGALERARTGLERAMQREVERGRLDGSRASAIAARVRYRAVAEDGLQAFEPCALVIEAVVENMDVKRALFARVGAIVGADCVLATNTSSLPIARVAAASPRPERVLGVHFFNPAPVMPLVEIVPWVGTDPAVTAGARALVDGWKKTTVVAADTPGFIVNRVARPFYGEALRLYEEGIADVATIDWAARELGGFRMGPFELMDLIGQDVNFAVTTSVYEGLFHDPRFTPSVTQQRLVDAGRLGRKTGRGFYDYSDGAVRPEPRTDRQSGLGLVHRILVMLINGAVEAVHWRVASPADIDLAVTKGVNYPRGLLAWGAELGFDWVLGQLSALHDAYGEDRYRPSVLLRRIVREGPTSLGDWQRANVGEGTPG